MNKYYTLCVLYVVLWVYPPQHVFCNYCYILTTYMCITNHQYVRQCMQHSLKMSDELETCRSFRIHQYKLCVIVGVVTIMSKYKI
jgi:hypothetical protein